MWISVRDKLPENAERILIADASGRVSLGSYHPLFSDGTPNPKPFWRDRDCGDSRMRVTHWSELPVAP